MICKRFRSETLHQPARPKRRPGRIAYPSLGVGVSGLITGKRSFAKGGHFAAWEQPQLFAEELRAAFKSLR
jgi:pimeloyl-ACP methyl ester carboxylesterase